MNTILIDGHAHLYPDYDIVAGLDAAKEAFRQARRSIPGAQKGQDCLILVDHPSAEGFRMLCESGVTGWQLRRLDSLTLKATREKDGASLLTFSGRQVRAANGLEVLGLLMNKRIPEGGALRECTECVLTEGGVAVLPWGFGKWWGNRGDEVRAMLESSLGRRIALSDSSTRPPGLVWSGRRQFELAKRLQVPILAGTDPLPLPDEEMRLGSFGFMLQGLIDLDRPAQSMHRILNSISASPRTFGRRETLIHGLRLQMAMQFRR